MLARKPMILSEAIKAFAFPLNAYAWCLLKETGTVRDLHYGLFAHPDEPVETAQRRSTDHIFRTLPPPCQLLEVGVGLGATLQRLLQSGFRARGITPDPHQAEIARAVCGNANAVTAIAYEQFVEQPGRWDLLLFQESAQYVDPLDLFAKAASLLKPQGEILLVDEFALERRDPGEEHLHLLAHFIALGARFGFEVGEEVDLSQQASLTVDFRLRVLAKHHRSLVHEAGISALQYQSLIESNRNYLRKYRDGRFGYRLLKLRLKHPQTRVAGWIRPEHQEAVRLLFNRAFQRTMTASLWHWKYGNNRGRAVGVWENSTLIAHYGGLTRAILYFGQPQFASQSADVMAARGARAGLAQHSAFFTAAATYLERTTGFGRPHLLGFGFPNLRARRAPEHLGLYSEPVGKMIGVSWSLEKRNIRRFLLRTRPLDLSAAPDRQVVDRCWHAMQQTTRDFIVGERDAAWLAHRYANHPEHHYELHAVSFRGMSAPFGVVVLKLHANNTLEWMDAVAARSHLRWLLFGIQRLAERRFLRVSAWISQALQPLFAPALEVSDLQIGIPSNAWTPGPAPHQLAGRWWLMGGDTDFL